MQSIDSIERYAHRTSKDLLCKKEEIKCNNIRKEHNASWPEILDHPYRILIVGY